MNERKFESLLSSAREEALPVPTQDFAMRVMREIQRELAQGERDSRVYLLEELNRLFPRVAMGAALLICLLIGGEVWISKANDSDLSSAIAQMTDQWLFASKGL